MMYHDVYRHSIKESGFNTNGANHYKIAFDAFEEQLQILSEMIANNLIKKEDVILTFDDGGVSFSDVIMPLLGKYGFKGHFYISTDYIGEDGFMTADQVKMLVENGHVVGSHSCSHPRNISSLNISDREHEWFTSIEKLDSICGCKTEEISIPNGYFSKKDTDIFKRACISKVYTSSIGEHKFINGVEIIGRIAIDSTTSVQSFIAYITGGWQLRKLVIKQSILQIIKSILGNSYIRIKKVLR